MAARDKNGETASERIARKFLSGKRFKDCNTVSMWSDKGMVLSLYGSTIAAFDDAKNVLTIFDNHAFSGSKLTKERKHALISEAKKRGIAYNAS